MRAYVDRISDNPELLDFEIDKKLYCKHCGRLMGLGYLYPPEQRPAYNLFQKHGDQETSVPASASVLPLAFSD